jgi:hypothetical protein
MSIIRTALVLAFFVGIFARSLDATAAEPGEVIVANNLGLPLWTHNFDSGKTTTIGDKLLLSEFMGAHCFVTEHLRLGMMFQWTEQYTGAVATGADRFTTFALLPQVGWVFSNHLAVAGIFTIAPISGGKHDLDLGVQALVGYGLPISQNAALNFAVELRYNFHVANTLGVTPLLGLTFRI